MQTLYGEGLTKSIFEEVKKQVLKMLEIFCQHGSGWTVKSIPKLE